MDVTEIALTTFTGRAGDHNDRAMHGAGLLGQAIADRSGATNTVLGQPEPALCTDWRVELAAALPGLDELAVRYTAILRAGGKPLSVLPRCACALATIPVVTEHHPDAVVVWLDAHADLNTPESTSSGYLGGLALSAPLGLWDSGLGAGLDSAILVGTRDFDPPERELLVRGMARHVPLSDRMDAELAALLEDRPVYVHLDCDVLEPGIVPTDYRVPDGMTLKQLGAVAETLAAHQVLGFELAEFEGAEEPEALLKALAPLLPG